MKILLLAFSLIIFSYTFSQSTPPKKASKIIVLVKDTANTLLDKISAELFDAG